MRNLILDKTAYSTDSETGSPSKSNYTILYEEKSEKEKYSLDIEIPIEIEESEIEDLFLNIENENPGFELYSLYFYLPHMEVGSGAWATVIYDKHLDINVRGLPFSSSEGFTDIFLEDSLGIWNDHFNKARIHLINTKGEYFIRSEFDDDSYFDKIVYKVSDEMKFIVPDSSIGDFYIILDHHLEVWDNVGIIDKYEILKNPDLNRINQSHGYFL